MTMDRRQFLRVGALLVPATYLAACDSEGPASARPVLRRAERWNERIERKLQRHTSIDISSPKAALAGDDFPKYYISDHVPVWDARVRGPWSLEVRGLVRKPRRFTLDELTKLPSVTYRLDHYCVEGWTAVATWTGVRVSELARVVELLPDVHYVDFQSFDDGYHESWDLESATHPQSLIAYGMDGDFLGPAHGGPARMYSPVKLGYKSTKYLTRVVFLPERNGGYWSDQGYEWYAGT
ncbi:MAG TPA: molybdopterin-dependent oxidoreductase [Gemmatimonadaceae bacterium]|nr:molybdopterin-dependent oxidoreductase [Gemmatimonadaceae bacterium]